jgi:potassium-transporting ATPase KdpC subunit
MKELKPAIFLFFIFSLICGGIYPAVVTGIACVLFPKQARGSLIIDTNNQIIGSSLIGQPFSKAKYFWPRPSATSVFAYNPLASGGSNFSPTNPDFIKTVGDRIQLLHDSGVSGNFPADLVEASASGLDPHVSVEAATIQIARVAKARGMSDEALVRLVSSHIEDRQWGVFGEPRVNVLLLNLALDGRLNE